MKMKRLISGLLLSLIGCSPVLAEEVLQEEKEETIPKFLILNVEGKPQEGRVLKIKDEEENVLAEWISDDGMEGSVAMLEEEIVELPEGEPLIFYAEEEHGIYAKPVEFTLGVNDDQEITEKEEEFTKRFELQEVIYVSLDFKTQCEEDFLEAEYTIFMKDEKTIANDIYGNPCVGISFDIAKGVYFYQQTNLEEKYYLDNMSYEFEIDEDQSITVEASPVLYSFSVDVKENQNRMDAHLSLEEEDGSVITRFTDKTLLENFPLKRAHKYILKSNTPDGFFAPTDISFETDSTKPEQPSQITMSYATTHVIFYAEDKDTKEKLNGAEWSIYDENNSFVGSLTSNVDGTTFTGLKAGGTYTITSKSAPQTYENTESQIFKVPEKIEDDYSSLTLSYTPYVSLTIFMQDENTNQPIEGTEFALYQDGNIATDIYGQEVKGVSAEKGKTYSLHNGSYELHITKPSKYAYTNKEVFPIKLNHAESAFSKVTGKETQIRYRFTCVDSLKQTILEGTTLQILDSDGSTVLAEWTTSDKEEGDVPTLEEKEILFEKDHTYFIRCAQLRDHFYHDSSLVQFTTSNRIPEITPLYQIELIPFVTYTIHQEAGAGFEYCFYEDEACTNLAKDVEGKNAIVTIPAEGDAWILLKEGTYWLKETRYKSNYWKTSGAIKVELNQENGLKQMISFSNVPITLSVILKDEEGQLLSGAKFSLYNKHGDLVDSWISDNTEHRIEKESLYAGMECILKEEIAPDGYEILDTTISYHIPDSYTTEPILEICNTKIKEAQVAQVIRTILKDDENKPKLTETIPDSPFSFSYYLFLLLGIPICGWIYQKMKSNKM